jgi:hypothetical protein
LAPTATRLLAGLPAEAKAGMKAGICTPEMRARIEKTLGD